MKKSIVIIATLVIGMQLTATPSDIYVLNNSKNATLTINSTTIAPNQMVQLTDVAAPAAFTISATLKSKPTTTTQAVPSADGSTPPAATPLTATYNVTKSQAALYTVSVSKSVPATTGTTGTTDPSQAAAPTLSIKVGTETYAKATALANKANAKATTKASKGKGKAAKTGKKPKQTKEDRYLALTKMPATQANTSSQAMQPADDSTGSSDASSSDAGSSDMGSSDNSGM